MPPLVTGISPSEAHSGAKLVLRGENLGHSQQDVIGLFINGYDCLMSLEWRSPNKILAICPPPSKDGKSDIIVVTKSGEGKLGSSTVQLTVTSQSIHPLKEVSIWIDEALPPLYGSSSKNRLFSSSLNNGGGEEQNADVNDKLSKILSQSQMASSPLHSRRDGLASNAFDERAIPTRIANKKMNSMFPGKNANIQDESFHPLLFLLQNYPKTSFEDLQKAASMLRSKVDDGTDNNKVEELKESATATMAKLKTMIGLKKRHEVDTLQALSQYPPEQRSNMTAVSPVILEIESARSKTCDLFMEVLRRKERADSTRSALNVLSRFKLLFSLPHRLTSISVEHFATNTDFDRVIDEYQRVKSLYAGVGQVKSAVFDKYMDEIESNVVLLTNKMKTMLVGQDVDGSVQKLSNIQEEIKCISILSQIDFSGADHGWDCIEANLKRLEMNLEQLLVNSKSEMNPNLTESDHNTIDGDSDVVRDVCEISSQSLEHITELGREYFRANLPGVVPDMSHWETFNVRLEGSVSNVVETLKSILIEESMNNEEEEQHMEYPSNEYIFNSLVNVHELLRCVSKLEIPMKSKMLMKCLTTDLRLHSLRQVSQNTIRSISTLYEREEWEEGVMEMLSDDETGILTSAPKMFKQSIDTCVDMLQRIVETGLGVKDGDDQHPLGYENATLDLINLVESIITSFCTSLEHSAIRVSERSNNVLICSPPSSKEDRMRNEVKTSLSKSLLICMNSCLQTRKVVLPQVFSEFRNFFKTNELGGSLMWEEKFDQMKTQCLQSFDEVYVKMRDVYVDWKSEYIISSIESWMYVGRFDWARCPDAVDSRDYVKHIITNFIVQVVSELTSVFPFHEDVSSDERVKCLEIEKAVVTAICSEINRIFSTVHKMNSSGCIQAWLDIDCLLFAFKRYLSESSRGYLEEAATPLHRLERDGDRESVRKGMDRFKHNMSLYLMSLGHGELTENH